MRNLAVVCLVLFASSWGWAEDEPWRLPMAEKEKILEKNIQEKHNMLGLYPSQVEAPLDGGPVDYSTRSYQNVAHSVCWTSNYLAGASYRYAYMKKTNAPKKEVSKALARADEIFEAVYRCQLVTGIRGLQARGYQFGHGESYEERWGDPTSDVWLQGAGEYRNLRWRGDPSHHNYSDAIHGLGQYYDLAAQGSQKERCREAIDALVGYWVDNDFKVKHYDGKRVTNVLGFTDGKTLNTRIMMAIAGAKVAHHATGNRKYDQAYQKLIDQYGVRGLKEFKTEKNFDDAEHVFCHLETLFRIEDDPELLAAYRVVLDALWARHKDDAQSLFTYIYMSLTPDAPDREQALRDAHFRLQTWPTDMLVRPTMSSLRTDLPRPLPTYAAAWDNEYVWKGNLLRPDGWLSRTVTGVAVPAEDPTVIYAVDQQGDVYQSRDGGATAAQWFPIDASLPSPARAIASGPRVRMVYAACDDGFYGSLTGGFKWQRLNVPEDGGKPVEMHVAQAVPKESAITNNMPDPIYLFAVRESAVYQCIFRFDREFDRTWEPLPDGLPPLPKPRPSALFKPGDNGVLRSTDGGATWDVTAKGLDIPVARTVFTSPCTDWVFAGTTAGLYISRDGGDTWQSGNLVLQFKKNERYDLGGAAYIDAYWRALYYGLLDEPATKVRQ